MSGFVPLSRRGQPGAQPPALVEGVPPHLFPHLRDWLFSQTSEEGLRVAAMAIQLPVETRWLTTSIEQAIDSNPDVLLDLVDAVLHIDQRARVAGRDELRAVLVLGGSAWTLAQDGKSLERRVDATVVAAKEAALSTVTNPSAADHLATAWASAYGLRPDPTKAYSEAIKAIEAAAAPVFTPADKLATLGKILGVAEGQCWQARRRDRRRARRRHRPDCGGDADGLGGTDGSPRRRRSDNQDHATAGGTRSSRCCDARTGIVSAVGVLALAGPSRQPAKPIGDFPISLVGGMLVTNSRCC